MQKGVSRRTVPKPHKDPTRLLNVHLLKEGTSDPKEIFQDADSLKSYEVPIGNSLLGRLYVGQSRVRSPRWLRLFSSVLKTDDLGLRVASASAVLIVKLKGRILALSFGQGRFLLRSENLEEHFGLHATLNAIDREHIRAIERKRFDAVARHTREQASREVSLADFGIDMEQDLIRALTGPPSDTSVGKRISGRDSLTVAVPAALEELDDLLSRYLTLGLDDAYKKEFPEIGNIVEVNRKEKREELDEFLLKKIEQKSLDRLWLSVPEALDWSDVEGFRYSAAGSATIYPDIHFDSYFEQVGAPENVSIAGLKRRSVYCVSASTEGVIGSWPIYRCIYAEIDTNDGTFLLDNGKWFRLDTGLVNTVNQQIAQIAQTSVQLLSYGLEEHESDYNERLAKSDPAQLALMDRKLIHYGGGKSQIEFCDIFSRKGIALHVKRYSGSMVLSHLFAQGMMAATLFLSDADFRKRLNQRLPKTHRLSNPAQRPIAQKYEIAFGIASRSRGPLILPFFSRVMLRNADKTLSNSGFKVTCTKIQVE